MKRTSILGEYSEKQRPESWCSPTFSEKIRPIEAAAEVFFGAKKWATFEDSAIPDIQVFSSLHEVILCAKE